MYFHVQVAYSHQNHEIDATNQSQRLKRMKTDSPPDTKSAEQSDEDVSRQENFKKGKKKVIGERQNAH